MLVKKNLLSGLVIRGDGRGKSIGFPTANLQIDNLNNLYLDLGVYAGLVFFKNKRFISAIHIGKASTFNKNNITFEVHILDFNQEIYGEMLTIQLEKKIRSTKKFDTVENLVLQMNKDINKIRNIYNLS